MKIIGIIPSRYGSSRFPGKPLIDIKGKSMIQRVYEGSLQSKKLEKVIVATDDQRIYDHVISFGGEVIMTNSTHPSGTDRCFEALEKSGYQSDVVINIQGDEPLVSAQHLDLLCDSFNSSEIEISTLIKPIQSLDDVTNENRIKVTTTDTGRALYFSRAAIPFQKGIPESQWLDNAKYYKHIGIYAYRSSILKKLVSLPPSSLEQLESLEQLRWMQAGYAIQTIETSIETPNIDTPEDLENVLRLL